MIQLDENQNNTGEIVDTLQDENVKSLQSQRENYVKGQMSNALFVTGPAALILLAMFIMKFQVNHTVAGLLCITIGLLSAAIYAERKAKKNFGPSVVIKDPALENLSAWERAKYAQSKVRASPEFQRSRYVSRKQALYFALMMPLVLLLTYGAEQFSRPFAWVAGTSFMLLSVVLSQAIAERKAQKSFDRSPEQP